MTVPSSINKWGPYIGNGVTNTFGYSNTIFSANDLLVTTIWLSNGAESTLAPSQYTVTNVGSPNGGNVVTNTPLPTGYSLTIERIIDLIQNTDFKNQGAFHAQFHEDSFDRSMMIDQQLQEQINSLNTIVESPSVTFSSNLFNVKDPPFNAIGNGVADDSAAFQLAINTAIAAHGCVYIPATSVGYKINTPLNLTNINNLQMVGDNGIAPGFGLAFTPPIGGSQILANTGGVLFDCLGANNLLFRDIFVNALTSPNASKIGFLLGTSTGVHTGSPGSSNYGFENVSIYLKNADNSVPIYGYNSNLSHFFNVWTLGVYGVMLTIDDVLSVVPPYGEYGPQIGAIGNTMVACNLLGYGGGQPLYLHTGHNFEAVQLYIDTVLGGATYAGQPYAIFLKDCTDVKIKVEQDYFPSLFYSEGNLQRVDISGTTFANLTPVPSNVPIIGFFNGDVCDGCNFAVRPVGIYPNNNYHYTSISGATPTMDYWLNSTFHFDVFASPNIAFFNASNIQPVPFRNIAFLGTSDVVTNSIQINGSAAPLDQQRISINGKLFGTG